MASPQILRFEDCELDRGLFQLRRGGQVVRLERIPLDLLFLLAERRGEVVSREEILERVWGKSVFIDTDSGINTAVRKIRRALHDDADSPRYLLAVPGRGYRFVARVRERGGPERRDGLSPLVGRVREMALLREGLARTIEGHEGFVMIGGEAGIGKSRLIEEVIAEARDNRIDVLIGHCVDPEESAAYLPFVEVLDLCVERATTSDDLRRMLGEEGPELARLSPRISRILPDLAIQSPDLPAPEAQHLLFKSYRDFLARLASRKPILLILEDLHWADESTFAMLRHLMQRMSGVPMLVVVTYRDSEIDLTRGLSRTLEEARRIGFNQLIALEGLPLDELGQLIGRLSGRVPPPQVVQEFLGATAGNPFFVGELFRHLEAENRLYDDAGDFRTGFKVAEAEVPRSVKLLVRTRLDRLSTETREILGRAALAGRSFTLEILRAANRSEKLIESIEQAERAGLIVSIAGNPGNRFSFSHELVRQAVISGLSAARRETLHLELGEAIELVHAGTLEDHFADLAYHYRRGGNTRKAVEFLSRAAAQAIERAAEAQALEHATFALDLLGRLPPDAARDRLELSIQVSYCAAVRATRGFAIEALRHPLARALELSERLGDHPTTVYVLDWLRAFHQLRAELKQAQQVGERLLALAEASKDPVAFARASLSLGHAFLLQGRPGEARRRCELAVGIDDFEKIGGPQAAWWKTDALAGLLYSLWLLGYPEQAERIMKEALDVAAPNPLAQAFALHVASWLRLHLGQVRTALELSQSAIAISTEYGLALELSRSKVAHGQALISNEQAREGLSEILDGSADYEKTGAAARTFRSTAEGLLVIGEIEQGLKSVNRTLEETGSGNERMRYPEFLRIKGELLLARGPSSAVEAEQAMRDAIEAARQQDAKSWELRATVSLARLLDKTKRRKEARSMLADIYGWFTEGFDSGDLKEARALLDELSV